MRRIFAHALLYGSRKGSSQTLEKRNRKPWFLAGVYGTLKNVTHLFNFLKKEAPNDFTWYQARQCTHVKQRPEHACEQKDVCIHTKITFSLQLMPQDGLRPVVFLLHFLSLSGPQSAELFYYALFLESMKNMQALEIVAYDLCAWKGIFREYLV